MTNFKGRFRPNLTKAEVNIIHHALLDRREYNPPAKNSLEFITLSGLIYKFETMEARSRYLISRRKMKKGNVTQ